MFNNLLKCLAGSAAGLVAAALLTGGAVHAQPSFFEEATAAYGVNASGNCGDVVWYDWDNDGDLDLLLAVRFGSESFIFQNDGGHFTRLHDIGLPMDDDGGRPIPMDFDHDGDLDLFFLHYPNYSAMYVNEGGHFMDRTFDLGLPNDYHDRDYKWIDFNHDGWMDLLLGNEESGFSLWRNDNGTHFTDVTAQSHLPVLTSFMQIAEADYDLDGEVDIFNTSLTGEDHLFHNDGNGVFTDVTQSAGLGSAVGTGGCVWVDIDHNKYPDLLTEGPQRHAIWHNNGDGTFTEMNVHGMETDFAGGDYPNTAYYGVADFDMDGDADIYVCRPGGCGSGLAANQFFIQDSLRYPDIWFHDVAPQWGLDYAEDGAPGIADFDGDGALDLYITRQDNSYVLLHNTINSRNSLQVRALGPNGELDRWHTRVDVYAHGSNAVMASSELNTSNVARSGMNNYFVLDENGHYDLRIYFANGVTMLPGDYPQLSDVVPSQINHLLTVYEGRPLAVQEVNRQALDFRLAEVYPNPFNSRTTIRYTMPAAGYARLGVYDVLGRRVKDLVNETVSAGNHSVQWNASSAASGVYFLRLEANNQVARQRALLLK